MCIQYENHTKLCCAKFVYFVSFALLAVGLIACVVGAMGPDVKETLKLGDKEFPSPAALASVLAIAAGLFTMITGGMGLLAARCKTCVFTMPFMILACIVAFLMLIAAIVCLAASQAGDSVKNAICTGEGHEPFTVEE